MTFSEEFRTECPDGYQPILNPPEWRTKDLVGNINFKTLTFDLPYEVNDVPSLMKSLTQQLIDHIGVNAACKTAMIRNRRNAFIVGIDNGGKNIMLQQIKALQTQGSGLRLVNISSDCIWLFQKCSEKPLG